MPSLSDIINRPCQALWMVALVYLVMQAGRRAFMSLLIDEIHDGLRQFIYTYYGLFAEVVGNVRNGTIPEPYRTQK